MDKAPARKVVLALGISLDGYIARLNGEVDFLFMPKDYSMDSFFRSVDTVIMGRKTLEAALKMGETFPRSSMKTYVFSRSKPAVEHGGIEFIKQSPASFMREVRKRPGKDIWHMGGGELAREFLRADLIDELHLGVVPTLLGEGIPFCPSGFPQRDFALIENKTYTKGLIVIKYKRVRGTSVRKRTA